MLDDLNIFISAAEKRSLTATAEYLGMTIATVSRRISALEDALGCELIHRSTKGLTLTPIGEAYYQECAEYIEALNQRLANLDRTLNSLSGELKVLAPTNLGSGPLDLFWQYFIQQYPSIQLNIELANAYQDMRNSKADIALRSGKQESSSLIQKYLGHIETILVAAPNASFPYPSEIDELAHCPSIAANMFYQWQLFHQGGEIFEMQKHHQHTSNDMNFTLNLAKSGAGIALMPKSIVQPALEEGSLIRVLPQWKGQDREIFLVWPYRRSLSARAKAFRAALIQFLANQPWFTPAP